MQVSSLRVLICGGGKRRDAVRGSGPSLPAASYSSSWCPHHRVWRFLRPPSLFLAAARRSRREDGDLEHVTPARPRRSRAEAAAPSRSPSEGGRETRARWSDTPSRSTPWSARSPRTEAKETCARTTSCSSRSPAFAHDAYLNALAPWIEKSANAHAHRPPCVLAAAVAQGGFDLAARNALQAARAHKTVVVAGLETFAVDVPRASETHGRARR